MLGFAKINGYYWINQTRSQKIPFSHHIFLDESGEISFSARSSYEHFALTTLKVSEANLKPMKNVIKSVKGALHKRGWPRELEIKAYNLHGLHKNPRIPANLQSAIVGDDLITNILARLCRSCNPEIDYIVIRKNGLTSTSFRAANSSIAYNYFAGKVLSRPVKESGNCRMCPDPRNKETHSKKRFKEYICTKLHEEAFDQGRNLTVTVQSPPSHLEPGLQAVDFFAWSVFRKYEYGDDRFYEIFKNKIAERKTWYIE